MGHFWVQIPGSSGSLLDANQQLGFYMGSGGLDGDGGTPDLDLTWGIAEHRSIFTHSILSGIAIEATVLCTLDLCSMLHSRLPDDHAILWDELANHGSRMANQLTVGASLGIAYHLGVDATVDGAGTYKDLPVSLPIEGHQAVAAANALLEGLDGALRAGDVAKSFQNFQDASKFVKDAQSTSFKIQRQQKGDSFEVIYAPRRT